MQLRSIHNGFKGNGGLVSVHLLLRGLAEGGNSPLALGRRKNVACLQHDREDISPGRAVSMAAMPRCVHIGETLV